MNQSNCNRRKHSGSFKQCSILEHNSEEKCQMAKWTIPDDAPIFGGKPKPDESGVAVAVTLGNGNEFGIFSLLEVRDVPYVVVVEDV